MPHIFSKNLGISFHGEATRNCEEQESPRGVLSAPKETLRLFYRV